MQFRRTLMMIRPGNFSREGFSHERRELISLKGVDIDFTGRFLHVQRNLSHGTISATKSGGSKGRYVCAVDRSFKRTVIHAPI
jgi:hypothetical protein